MYTITFTFTFDGEICLTEKGKENREEICRKLKEYCNVYDDATDCITIWSDDHKHYNEVEEYIAEMSEAGYIAEAWIDIDDRVYDECFRLIYRPGQNEWQLCHEMI